MRRILIPIVVILVLLMQVACGASTPEAAPTAAPVEPTAVPVEPTDPPPTAEASMPELAIEATNYAYAAPKTVEEGWVRVQFTNAGSEPFHVQFLRLNDGVTFEQFTEALQQGEGPALALVGLTGGVGATAPEMTAQSVLNLPAGEYVLLSFMASPGEEAPQFTKGMIKTLTVQENGAQPAAAPDAGLTIEMADFTFDMPDTLPAGETVIQVVNNGPEHHEWNLIKLSDGMTVDDFAQYMESPEGPPPFAPIGGMNGLDAGAKGYVEADLTPGTYIAVCFIPSPAAQGQPHHELGMIKSFTVN